LELLVKGAVALGIALGDREVRLFERYYEELAVWNRKVNLTAITERDEVQSRHFVDSLSVVLAVPTDRLVSARIADVGSGAGFPGVPLAIVFPESRVTLIESTAKKTAFLSHLKESLGLGSLVVLTGRAEELAHRPDLREKFDLVLSRAVAEMAALSELTLPFCRVGGTVVLHKRPGIADELGRASHAIETLGGQLSRVVDVDIEVMEDKGTLVVLDKVAPTPTRYPRRPGMPAKRPL
jgi:16S rRNA (guanine527-N7)-methyltransferase